MLLLKFYKFLKKTKKLAYLVLSENIDLIEASETRWKESSQWKPVTLNKIHRQEREGCSVC